MDVKWKLIPKVCLVESWSILGGVINEIRFPCWNVEGCSVFREIIEYSLNEEKSLLERVKRSRKVRVIVISITNKNSE